MSVASPCVGLCRLQPSSDLCLGCARTAEEIAGWGAAGEEARRAVWEMLPARRERLGICAHRLSWTTDDIRSFIVRTLVPGAGTWVCGVRGALAEFSIGSDDIVTSTLSARSVSVSTALGAIGFRISSAIRAFAFGNGLEADTPGVVVLAVPGDPAETGRPTGLTCGGPDHAAIVPSGRAEMIYDLGLGSRTASFGIRTGSDGLIDALCRHLGQPWSEMLAGMGADLVRASPTRVVRHATGRIEVFSEIPPPGGASPAGPHTHLLPAQLVEGGELPPASLVPSGFLPCAIHYPGSHYDQG